MKGSTGAPGAIVCTKATWKAFRRKLNSAKGRMANEHAHAAIRKQTMAGKIVAVPPPRIIVANNPTKD
jgi:hypothetical protein